MGLDAAAAGARGAGAGARGLAATATLRGGGRGAVAAAAELTGEVCTDRTVDDWSDRGSDLHRGAARDILLSTSVWFEQSEI